MSQTITDGVFIGWFSPRVWLSQTAEALWQRRKRSTARSYSFRAVIL